MESIQINREALIEKFPGKGGWAYIIISEISPVHRNHFGQVKINGFIDDYVLENVVLMPLGNGQLFLSLNAKLRKILKKTVGDTVQLQLTLANSSTIEEVDFLEILVDEPSALSSYRQLTEEEKKHYLDWINATKNQDVQVERIAKIVNELYDKGRYQKTYNVLR